jgi:tetratricopeptide (TPR) repeat protein
VRETPTPAQSAAKSAPQPVKPGGAAGAPATAGASDAAAAAGVHPDVPPAARTDFDRAVKFMRAGNATEAELDFKQIALQYPQFAAPLVNLAILQRKDGHLDQAEETLKGAVARENGSAVAWTELGVTQRMRGKFKDAAASYEQAIGADARYAPAWRNLGVVEDLYLGDPNRALTAFEQYKTITGEDKPVSGWIAELRQRLGIKKPEAAPAPAAAPEAAPATTPAAPAAAPGAAPANASATPPAPKPGG